MTRQHVWYFYCKWRINGCHKTSRDDKSNITVSWERHALLRDSIHEDQHKRSTDGGLQNWFAPSKRERPSGDRPADHSRPVLEAMKWTCPETCYTIARLPHSLSMAARAPSRERKTEARESVITQVCTKTKSALHVTKRMDGSRRKRHPTRYSPESENEGKWPLMKTKLPTDEGRRTDIGSSTRWEGAAFVTIHRNHLPSMYVPF